MLINLLDGLTDTHRLGPSESRLVRLAAGMHPQARGLGATLGGASCTRGTTDGT
jgi:hypothetical protein